MFKKYFFRNVHTSFIKKCSTSDFRQTADLFQMGAELYLLLEDRRKYLNNPLKGYLNINSVRNIVGNF